MGIYKIIKSRRPWFTFFFTLFFGPTFGMMYVNRGLLAIIYLLAEITLYYALYIIFELQTDSKEFGFIDAIIYLSYYVVGSLHATYIARNFNKYEDLKWFSKIIPPLVVSFIILIPSLLIARTIFYEPFNIQSTSMEPTFSSGDVIYVKKSAYGYSKYVIPFNLGSDLSGGRIYNKAPERGDVVIFAVPKNTEVDYFKRIIGLPGDTIQMIRGELYINDQKIEHKKIEPYQLSDDKLLDQYIETLPNGRKYKVLNVSDNEYLDNTPLYTVPEKHYFMMGDNRDNSSDSRVFGAVHEDYLIGKALFMIKDGRTNQYVFRSVEKE